MKTILLTALVFCSAFFALEARHHHRCHRSRSNVHVNLGAPVGAYVPMQPAYVPVQPAPMAAYPAGYYYQESYYAAPVQYYQPAVVAQPVWPSLGFSFRL